MAGRRAAMRGQAGLHSAAGPQPCSVDENTDEKESRLESFPPTLRRGTSGKATGCITGSQFPHLQNGSSQSHLLEFTGYDNKDVFI